jgi:hypothetical protein
MMFLVTCYMYRYSTARSSPSTQKSLMEWVSEFFPTVHSEKVANDGFLDHALYFTYLIQDA